MLTLGVDIGTFESKGVLVDGLGRIVAEARRAHEMIVPRPGWAEHRAEEDWWGDFGHITKALLAKADVPPEAIGAVACSGIGPCMLPVDAEGRALMNAVLYGVDTRASAEIAELNATLGEAEIQRVCGNALTSQAAGPKILWLRRTRPEIWEKTARIETCTSFLVQRLTGVSVMDHYTAANFAPLYDITCAAWRDLPEICPKALLPRLLWTSEIAGTVTARASAETGLAPGTPVICGTIDAAAEAVSVGTGLGEMMVMYGSTLFMIEVTARRLEDPRLWHAPWLWPGQFAVMAGLATSGTLTHWFRETLARDLPRDSAFATLTADAEAAPKGAKGLICLPYFSGERTPLHDPGARGVFFGLDLTHGRGDLFRAVLEGIACGTAHVLETCAEAGASPVRLRAVGGGTRSSPWMQATSDFAGLPQEVAQVSTGASYGDAFLAALAIGAVSATDIARWNPVARRVEPAEVPGYAAQFARYKALYRQTRDLL